MEISGGDGSSRPVAVRRAQQAQRNPPLSSLGTSPFPRHPPSRGASQAPRNSPLPSPCPTHGLATPTFVVRKGAPITSPLSSHSPSSVPTPTSCSSSSQAHLPFHRHAPSQHSAACPMSAPRHALLSSSIASTTPSSVRGSRLLLVACLPRAQPFAQAAGRRRRVAAGRPSSPRRLTAGPPRGGPRTSARRSAASRRPTARYHSAWHGAAWPRRPRRPLLSSKPLGVGSIDWVYRRCLTHSSPALEEYKPSVGNSFPRPVAVRCAQQRSTQS